MPAGPCTGALRRKLPTGHPSEAGPPGHRSFSGARCTGTPGCSRRPARLREAIPRSHPEGYRDPQVLRQNIKFWALLAEECSWAVGQALPVTVRAAGVKAVSPAERGRSVATRLDADEHAVMLIGPTARVNDARVLAATGAPPPPRSSRFHGQAVAHRPAPFASIGETTGRARSAAGAGGRPRGPTGRARSGQADTGGRAVRPSREPGPAATQVDRMQSILRSAARRHTTGK